MTGLDLADAVHEKPGPDQPVHGEGSIRPGPTG
jgi:hypothetical protein